MNKNTQGLIVVFIVAGFVYFAYRKFVKPSSRKVVTNYLDATFGKTKGHSDFVNSADKGYIDSWSKAIMNGLETFMYNGNTFITKGGKRKQ